MGENHVIQIRYESSENQSENSVSNILFSKSTTSIGKFVKTATIATLALNTAKYICKDLPLAYLSRVGEYTGDLQKQNQINDALSNWNILKSTAASIFINPIGTIMNEYIRQRDYNLRFQKLNESSEYLRKELLININKGGDKI